MTILTSIATAIGFIVLFVWTVGMLIGALYGARGLYREHYKR